MNFATPHFLLFLVTIFVISLLIRSKEKRKLLLLVASYFFYATWNTPFIALILLSTSIDYFLSKQIERTEDRRRRTILLTLGISVNLLILGVFKYFNFFAHTVNHTMGALLHHAHVFNTLEILLPLGISFYTFEAIGYLVDVFRGEKTAENFYDYNFYIMYFPHLISGPIVRYRELAPQIKGGISLPSVDNVQKGLELIVLGLAFKLLIADTVSTIADPVFHDIRHASISETYLAWAAFTTQIYFDFMGYTHIARGVSLLFNVSLPLNFDHPYNASNISNFWQRWHISLSRWIRDYLFISLGGSRLGKVRTVVNLLITMTIAGAWHGAGWPFIVWGLYHGMLLLSYHLLEPLLSRLKNVREHAAYRSFSIVVTFVAVALGWIWFRSPDFSSALLFFKKIFRFRGLFNEWSHAIKSGDYSSIATLVMLIILCTTGPWLASLYKRVSLEIPCWLKVHMATLTLVICYVFAGFETKPFIYFQF